MTKERYERYIKAEAELRAAFRHPHRTHAIHYSCERLGDQGGQQGPGRITSIAIHQLETGQAVSFSLGEEIDRLGLPPEEVDQNLSDLEQSMLDRFEAFLHRNAGGRWLVWNMRDRMFGFPALAHRYEMFGKHLTEIPPTQIINVSGCIWDMYGDNYVGHPRFARLRAENNMTNHHFLEGDAEAQAYTERRYNDLNNSTIVQAREIADFARMALEGSLITDVPWYRRPNVSPSAAVNFVQEHPLYGITTIVLTIVGVLALVR